MSIYYLYEKSLHINKFGNTIFKCRDVYDKDEVDRRKKIISFYKTTILPFLCIIYMDSEAGHRSITDKDKNIRTYLANVPKITSHYLKANFIGGARDFIFVDYMFSVTPSFTHGRLRFMGGKKNIIKVDVILEGGKRIIKNSYNDFEKTTSSYVLSHKIFEYSQKNIDDSKINEIDDSKKDLLRSDSSTRVDLEKYIEWCKTHDVYEKNLDVIKFLIYVNMEDVRITKNNLSTIRISENDVLLKEYYR